MVTELIEKLRTERRLEREEYLALILDTAQSTLDQLGEAARAVTVQNFGHKIYTRGLIEVSNYCRRNCYYCGIRRDNCAAERYRLSKQQIMQCCADGYQIGFRTFVMQGGEDMAQSDDFFCDVIASIRATYPDCAVTLSLGERSFEALQRFFDAGANRYLLRHEAVSAELYGKLHPQEMSLKNRIDTLRELKRIGYQTGTGIMVGCPYQTADNVVDDVLFIQDFAPEMIGIGPFLPQSQTPFGNMAKGSMTLTLKLISIFRLMFPHALIPSTTSLGTIAPEGRSKGILAGANVVMPNLSPREERTKYLLYDNKLISNAEAAEDRDLLRQQMAAIGYEVSDARGDYKE